MSLPLLPQLGIAAAILLVGVRLERAARQTEPVVSVPGPVRTAVRGLALCGPWILHHEAPLPAVSPVDDSIVALALSVGLYLVALGCVGTGAAPHAPDGPQRC